MFTLEAGTWARTELVVKRSRFIASLYPVSSGLEARSKVQDIRSEFPDARHNCSAFIIAAQEGPPRTHSSDDGEPSGTAGPPILEVLSGANLVNVVAVITRYFGGVLLGTGGLVRAYSDATRLGLSSASIVERVPLQEVSISVPGAVAGRFESEVHQRGWRVTGAQWGSDLDLTLALSSIDVAPLEALAASLVRAPVEVRVLGTVTSEVPVSTRTHP